MGMLQISSVALAVSFILGCSPKPSPEPPPPAKTVFDPLTQQLDKARDVQKAADSNADATRKAVDAQERGDHNP
jgi:hypothetical protein